MSTPQDPAVRSRQKRRRTKQLAAWREKKAAEAATSPAKKAPEKKAAEKASKKAAPKA
jgi:hypothetical protein